MQQRVAILGGGLAGLTTAFHLSAPEMQGRFAVTVYQLGWRLGGKCATGRNAEVSDRIQEHGLHVFMGQYQNAFAMVQALYAEAKQPPFPTWREAFTQQPSMTLMENVDGAWVPWVIDPPVFPGTPGIDPPPSLFARLIQMLEWIVHQLEGDHAWAFAAKKQTSPSPLRRLIDRIVRFFTGAAEDVAIHFGRDLLRVAIGLLKALSAEPREHPPRDHQHLASVIELFRDWLEREIAHLLASNAELRHFFILADLGLANLVGGLRDGLLTDPAANLAAVNRLDYKQWLRSHGAHEITVESALVRSLYDLIFAYPEGDWQGDGNVEAGTMFVSLTQTMRYQGSIVWKFNTATGDLVMTPMYEVLKARGVQFEFFARVDALEPDALDTGIASVRIGRQVALKSGSYEPLRTLPSGQRVWPDRPLFDQIVDGEELGASGANLESWWTDWPDAATQTLVAGQDYDLLVLAIPPAAHPVICADILDRNPAWRTMVGTVQTTATQSLQTWMTKTEAELGFSDPALVGGYDRSNLDSWADISQVLATENWTPASKVIAEQIACGPLPCPRFPPPRNQSSYPAEQQGVVDAGATQYLDDDAWVFWGKYFGKGGPPRSDIVASIYSRANIDPSERYTLSVTGSTETRLRTDGSGYANLFLAGDWIQNGQNLGSFEATTVSGILAARAISGVPIPVSGVDAPVQTGPTARPATGALPRYVDYPGQATFPGPISLADTTMWAFLLEADLALMQAWCQTMFDLPSGGAVRVVPLTGHMLMSVVDIGKGTFPEADYMGWSQERELTFWIPAARLEERDGVLVATKFDLVMPYLVLDNPVAIASGREIFGYMKQKGWIGLPGDPGQPDGTLSVDLFATKAFGAASEEQRQRLLTLSPAGQRPGARSASFSEAAGRLHAFLRPDIEQWHPGLAFGADFLANILAERVPQLFLKQFRDIADTRGACYQAVTETMGEITRFDSFPDILQFHMQLEALASSPIAAQFGIAPSQRIEGVRIEYDMTISSGRVIWQA